MSRLNVMAVALVLCLHAAASLGAEAELELVRDGVATCVIVLPDQAAEAEQVAAKEIEEHIKLISGCVLPIVSPDKAADGQVTIRIGSAADAGLEALIRERGEDSWAFAIRVDAQGVDLRGLSPEGSRSAAYELLEMLGVRWYMPGEIGRVIPQRKTLRLKHQQDIQIPSYEGRRTTRRDKQWSMRVRLGGEGRYGRHGIPPFAGKEKIEAFKEHPEYFGLVNGVRARRQLCLTNSTDNIAENQVLQKVVAHHREILRKNPGIKILHMGPEDGAGYCECSHCKALDPAEGSTTPFATPGPSMTDRYVWFFNQVTDALADEFPGVRVGFYAYAKHMMPPVKAEAKDNLAISWAPILTCRIHGPNNPVCPESNFSLWAFERWRPYAGTFIADRGYLYNLADPGYPFSIIHRIREEIPAYHDAGVRVWAADPADAWASYGPGMYTTAKLLWNHKADVDALLNEFFDLFYGPATAPMGSYYRLIDQTISNADLHTGSVWDLPAIYTPEMRSEARRYLEEASRLAEPAANPMYAQRITIVRTAFDFLEAYCEQRRLRDAFDFPGAYQAMLRGQASRDSLMKDFEYSMLVPYHGKDFFERFVKKQAMQEYETTGSGKGAILAKLDHTWKFQLDPYGWGQFASLQREDSAGGNWQTIRTDSSWSTQGLRYYFGHAWYRQEVEIPDAEMGKRVFLWFSGVDSTADVWLNGTFVGANHGGAEFDLNAYGASFRPFQFDVTELLRRGGKNVVTVRTLRHTTKELGTGGIMGPVMIYAAAEAGL